MNRVRKWSGSSLATAIVVLSTATWVGAEVPGHNPDLDHRCGEGHQWSRSTVACEQANCPPGSSRTYTLECNCGEAWNKPFRTCHENGLASHCVGRDEQCDDHPSGFDPLTGGCKDGWEKDDEGVCRPTGGLVPPTEGPNSPPQVSVVLENPQAVTTGLKIRFIGQVSDDRDSPDEMSYRWTLTHLPTGRSRSIHTRKRSVKTTLKREGAYRLVLEVTDSDGGKGSADLDFEVKEATIEKFHVLKEIVGKKHKTHNYWKNGLPAVRRGYWMRVGVELENFNKTVHDYRLNVIGFKKTASGQKEIPVEVLRGRMSLREWTQGRRGGRGQKYWINVSVPGEAPIGIYDLEFVLLRREDDSKIASKPLEDQLVVLFNPYDDATVADPSFSALSLTAEESLFRTHLYTWGRGESNGYSRARYDVSPHDEKTLRFALGLVHDLSPRERADATIVAKKITEGVSGALLGMWKTLKCAGVPDTENRRILGGMTTMALMSAAAAECARIGGTWVDTYAKEQRKIERNAGQALPPGGRIPWLWNSAGEIFEQIDKHGFAYWSQCFVYGMSLTAALRAVGIPSRMIGVAGSVHDQAEPWAIASSFYDRNGENFFYEPWNFHVWNEAWLPTVNSAGGWSLVDATIQGRFDDTADSLVAVPGRQSARSAGPLARNVVYDDSDDAVFVHAETNLPSERVWFDCDATVESPDPDVCTVNGSVLRRLGPTPGPNAKYAWVYLGKGRYANVIGSYRAGRTSRIDLGQPPFGWRLGQATATFLAAALRPTPAMAQGTVSGILTLEIEPKAVVSSPLTVAIQIEELTSEQQVDLVVHLESFPREMSGGGPPDSGLRPTTTHMEVETVQPNSGRWTGNIEIPGEAFPAAGHYRLTVGLDGVEGAMSTHDVEVMGLPILLEVPASVPPDTWFDLTAEVRNPLRQMVAGVRLRWNPPPAWEIDGALESETKDLAPASSLKIELRARSIETGSFAIQASADGAVGPSLAAADVLVTNGPEVSLDASPHWGPPGREIVIEVEVINGSEQDVEGAEVTLGSVEGVQVLDSSSQVVVTLEPFAGQTLRWRVQAQAAGIYELPVTASAKGLSGPRETLLLTVADSEPEGPEGTVLPPGSTAEPDAESEEMPSVFAGFVPAPSSGGGGATPPGLAGGGGGGGGGGGSAATGTSALPVEGFLLAGLLLGITALGLGIVWLRRRPAPLPSGPAWGRLDLTLPDGRSGRLVLSGTGGTIGRDPGCRWVIDDSQISSRHAELTFSSGHVVLRDLGSRNGTIVNGRPVSETVLEAGDIVQLGASHLVFQLNS